MGMLATLSIMMPLSITALNLSKSEVNLPETLTLSPVSYGGSLPSDLERDLRLIDDFSTANLGSRCVSNPFVTVKVDIDTTRYKGLTSMADTVAEIMSDYGNFTAEALLSVALQTLQPRLPYLLEARSVAMNATTGAPLAVVQVRASRQRPLLDSGPPPPPVVTVLREPEQLTEMTQQPWFLGDRFAEYAHGRYMTQDPSLMERGVWTYPYLCCDRRRWLLSYTVRVPPHPNRPTRRISSFISFDVDVSQLDINQCDVINGSSDVTAATTSDVTSEQLNMFRGSHKCHETTTCSFSPGRGWVRGGYVCRCRSGFYSAGGQTVFDGTSVEVAYEERRRQGGGGTYDMLYVCKPCAAGCGNCTSDRPCMATYNWVFRIVLLTISMTCVLLTFIVIGLIVRYKRLKVIKAGSPIFLTVTLLGCAAMYMEMAAIFPVLDMYSCVATKWTRHMGFCITYSALLLKTWRVSLTYRVKSAHKLKLTDKQLLQWLFPILLIMIIYLCSWTVSDPPVAVLVEDAAGLQFRQCEYGWWDHSLAAGELLFLFWGIKVCVNVRNAQTLFDEAKYISWAIYNIAIVNIAMATVHVFITSGPDVKYLLGFVRTQLSTTTTIALILAPKFYRIAVGQGDEYDARAQARGAAASFYLNGIEPDEGDISIYRENEELKEEVQKLAAQIEFMKIVHMEANNRHLKPRREGYFSQSLQGRRKSSMGAALRLEAYTNLQQDCLAQTGNEV